jgi:hypothetical protein
VPRHYKNMKKDILIIDYLPDRVLFFIEWLGHHNLKVVDNVDDALWEIEFNKYDYIFLGGQFLDDRYGGATVALYLNSHQTNPNYSQANIVVHSWDIAEVEKVLTYLPRAIFVPYNEEDLVSMFYELNEVIY